MRLSIGSSKLDILVLVFGSSFGGYLYLKCHEPRNLREIFVHLGCIPALLALFIAASFRCDLSACCLSFASYDALILVYTVLYRVSRLHPLAEYPGPFLAKISKLWSSYVCSQGKQHIYYERLHKQYGDFVRVGPNELSIRDASAIQPVLGPGGLPKGPWWAHWPNVGPVLIGMRHTGEHARRRRPWNRAFTGSALKDYEDIVTKRSRQLAERLDGLIHSQGELPGSGAVLDLGAWLSYFATDLMGDMAFGGGFELVRDGRDTEGVWAIMKSGLRASAICAHASWIFHFIKLAPSLQRRVAGLQEFATKSVTRRMEIGAWRKDLFFHLSDEEKHESVAPTFEELAADGILAIVAGADTSATVLTAFFWYLLQNPGAYQRLQQEVDNTFSGGEEITDAVKLSQMEWLNGCINEACRLQPPLPSGTQRSVGRGKGPKVIGTNVIPDETQIFVHTYSVQRDPRNFTSPDSFLPERWLNPLPKEISTHNTAAFFPFSYGPANCAGKNLALLQMRTVICWLMQRFELQRANDHKLPRLEEWADGLQDFYVMGKGPLWVRAVRRN